MMNAGAFVFDEMEEDRGEGHGRKQQLTKDKMHIKVIEPVAILMIKTCAQDNIVQ